MNNQMMPQIASNTNEKHIQTWPKALHLATSFLCVANFSNHDDDFRLYGRFYSAVWNGDWKLISEFLTTKPNAIRARIRSSGRTALHIAAIAWHAHIVEKLVDEISESDLEMKDSTGSTALALAAAYGANISIAQCMVDRNDRIVSVRVADRFPAVLAFRYGHKGMGRYLYSVTPLEELVLPRNGVDGATLICDVIYMKCFDLLSQCPELAITVHRFGTPPLYALVNLPSAFPSGSRPLGFWQQWVCDCICINQDLTIKEICKKLQNLHSQTNAISSAFTVPGGADQDTGFPMFLHMKMFMVFVLSDSISLFSSTTSVLKFFGILTSRYAEEDYLKSLPKKMIIGLSTPLLLSIATMMIAYCSALLVTLEQKSWVFIPIVSLNSVPVTLFVLMQFPLLVEIYVSTYGAGIFYRKLPLLVEFYHRFLPPSPPSEYLRQMGFEFSNGKVRRQPGKETAYGASVCRAHYRFNQRKDGFSFSIETQLNLLVPLRTNLSNVKIRRRASSSDMKGIKEDILSETCILGEKLIADPMEPKTQLDDWLISVRLWKIITDGVESAVQSLREEFGEQHVWGTKCDVREGQDVKDLVSFAQRNLGYIDIWVLELACNLLNLGSWSGLVANDAELRMQDVKSIVVHNLSPGMATTDLLMSGATTKQAKFFINVLAEPAEVVTEYLVPNIRSIIANGTMKPTYIRFLTGLKAYTQIFSLKELHLVPEETDMCLKIDRMALLHFKHSFFIFNHSIYDHYCWGDDIRASTKIVSWKNGTDCCTWSGVTCNKVTGNVIHLNLHCGYLQGVIHSNSTLFFLHHLRSLDLSFNNFSGSQISANFGRFTSMRHLDLSYSSFDGQVPREISYLSQLLSLDLSENYGLKLETWSLQRITANQTNLKKLRLGSVYMSFVQTQSLMNLSSSLTSLDLSGSGLKGKFPEKIFLSPNLQVLRLSYNKNLTGLASNQFIGTIQEFRYASLSYLYLEGNKLHGPIPISVFQQQNLMSLDLSQNNLSGAVGLDQFSKLKNLWYLSLSYNKLSLSFNNFDNYTLPNLAFLELSSCNISEFPYFLRASEYLLRLDLSRNKIQGNIPKWLWNVGVDTLGYLNLSHNLLTGHVPEQLPWKYLDTLDLRSNLIQGHLPIPPSTSIYFISSNQLFGQIPSSICALAYIEVLDLSHNTLNGSIPLCLGNLSYLSVLDLRMNMFDGTIPTTFSKGNTLRNIDLNGNRLKGPLPRALLNCRKLEILDLGNNMINDTFPRWLESLPKLQVLILRSNKLHGSLGSPEVRFPFRELRIMDLSNNNFSGLLPTKYFENFLAMVLDEHVDQPTYMGESMAGKFYDDSVVVTMKGVEIELERILSIFTTIDFSKNNFDGEIPKSLGNLKSLKGLNLSHSKISGHIPISLGNLTNLEWLDLSSNYLSGEIPMQLTEMNFLSKLNLSQNHLVGAIPHSNQFNTFDNNSYIGNLGLCGFPLTKTCGNDEAQPPSASVNDHQEDTNGFDWKYVFMGYVSGLVIEISVGYMFFSDKRLACLMRKVGGERWLKLLKRRKRMNGRFRKRRRN
ncbi:hypothetical protein FNV43_RR25446 [Rhamnella rubrinervis]|uniref:PGG domain-containing protein n=1 Tax=Rhamnella rubrinervis TaxID=2594499 RepID=A0A8K0DU93_9ROSA|nr:hypothetical protein FNV43_RR25446 [Rhamnella rubrinervis]